MSTLIRSQCGIVACLLAIGMLLGCQRLDDQTSVESRVANDVTWWIKMHELAERTAVTNLAQTFPNLKHGYPYWQHHELTRFGKFAGFTNSLAEKYIFFWPR